METIKFPLTRNIEDGKFTYVYEATLLDEVRPILAAGEPCKVTARISNRHEFGYTVHLAFGSAEKEHRDIFLEAGVSEDNTGIGGGAYCSAQQGVYDTSATYGPLKRRAQEGAEEALKRILAQ